MPAKSAAIQPSTVNAVIYARYSSHNQTEQSIEGQLHDCHAYAERMGYTILHEYIDRALTGTKDTRPDFQRMIRDAEKRQFQLVIVWKLDRFARNRYDSAIYKAKLKRYGVRVVSVMENINDGPEGIILEGILESMAEYYSANLAENVRRGLRESVNKGQFAGGPVPLGYRVDGHRLAADERTAPLAQEIFRRYADGESPSVIAADLNARGYKTRLGRSFRVSSFDTMLSCRTYIGEYTYSGQVIEGVADAIIDKETFDRAAARRAKNRHAPAAKKAREPYQLQGKIFCGHCGAPMIGESGRSRNGEIHQYYACAKRKKEHTCRKKNEKKGFIEWYVCEQTVAYVLDPERIGLIAERVVAEYDKEFGGDQVRELEKRIHRLDNDLEALVDSLLTLPASARARIGERMERLEAEKADAEIDLAKLKLASGIRLTVDQVKAWLRSYTRGDLLDPAFRQRIIDVFVNSVYLYDDKIVIFYNLRGGQETSAIGDISELDEMIDDDGGGSVLSGVTPPLPIKSEPRYIFVRGMIGIVITR
jgi:DNA invertase Pin-like site-specific DNA recombinase